MNEVRQHWLSFKSPRSSIIVAGNSTWYDVPAPVIVHQRNFEDNKVAEEKREYLANEADGQPQEVLYQNNVEARLNGLNAAKQRQDEDEERSPQIRESSGQNGKKRHSSSIELTAATSVKTDADGVPVITFSFYRTDDKSASSSPAADVDVVDGVSGGGGGGGDAQPAVDQLYDFPRGLATETSADSIERAVAREAPTQSPDSESQTESMPASTQSEAGFRGFRRRASPGSRSLKWRRSLGKLEDLVRPGGQHQQQQQQQYSGSLSDSESGPRRWAPRKKRLGRAWERMRTWLSEERTRIGDVVARHARMQAVGARLDDVAEEGPAGGLGACTGSYDLARARLAQGQLPLVEEFGLDGEGPRRKMHLQRAIKKTASSDDILAEEATREQLPATSFSLERLCSDDEEEEEEEDAEEPKGKTLSKRDRRRFATGGLIKKRMLGSIRGLIASTHRLHEPEESGPGGFEEVRRYVKQGGDFCKELAAILHERAELEANYAKGLSKLSGKLTKACAKDQGGNGSGGVSESWRCVGEEMEAAAEAHRAWGSALSEQLAKPLRVGVAEVQGRTRKSIENSVDKASKSLQEWRTMAAKTKKQSFACARENERLQDLARIQSLSQTHQQHQQQQLQQQSNNKLMPSSNGHHHVTDKEATKLETRRRKAEDSARRADTEFYTVTIRAERARLEYECAVRKAAKQMELLEEERLSALKDLANVYLAHLQALAPKLQQSADRLSPPIRNCSVAQDVEILKNLIRRIDSNDSSSTEQLLPDFYAEHVTLAMNRERRKQALVRVLHLIRQDLERERRGREGLETLHRAFIKTPAFAADESTQNVMDKLLHMRSMLTYLEAARYKVGGALSELEGGKRGKHPLAEHILVSRDKQGLQQSVLKVPSWAKNESFEIHDTSDGEFEVLHLSKDSESEQRDWADRTAGDGNSENHPDEEDFSDFDEFSSNSEDNNNQDVDSADVSSKPDDGLERCRAIYQYSANLNDELSLNPGDLITVHEKQADGWWIGECRGRTGIFPATYVQVIN